MVGISIPERSTGRTVLALLALLSIVFSSMALVTAQPARAATLPAILALSEDCSQDNKQIDVSGSDLTIDGDIHSNAGIHVSGSDNHANGAVTFDDENCNYEIPGSGNTGGFLSPSHAPSMDDPNFAIPSGEACDFDFSGQGDVDLHNEDVWVDADTLMPGVYCHDAKLQQSRQPADGTVSFYSSGYIDLSNASDNHLVAFRSDGVLLHSEANSVDGVKLAGSNASFAGIIYVPDGEAEVSGQFITTGCIVAETVKLDGSDNIIGDECGTTPPPTPQLEITKDNDTTGPVEPGTEVNFTLTVDVTDGPVTATITDVLPEGYDAPTDISDGGTYSAGTRTITWGPLSVADGDTFTYTAAVSLAAEDGDTLVNVATITSPDTNCPPDATEPADECDDDSTVVVTVPPEPGILILKDNDTTGPVEPGDTVGFTITVHVSNGPAVDATVVDTLPDGYDDPTDISDSGVWNGVSRTITWGPMTIADGDTFTYSAAVSDDVADGTELRNVVVITSPGTNCPPEQSEPAPECDDDSTVTVDVPPLAPALVIDKVADATTITISGPANAQVATPSIVTWTLTYTLTNGPVDNAVITDDIPVGFTFLDATDGGTESGGTVTWNLGTIATGGSVSFRTTVDPATISRVAPTVNVAVIDSDQTGPDEGEDAVTVTVEAPPLGGNPTPSPSPSLPDTAFGFSINGTPVSVPVEALVLVFLGSLGALGAANVRARRLRR